MSKVAEIRFLHGIDERRKFEIAQKEWCDDLVVRISEKEYRFYVISRTRLMQEMDDALRLGNPYLINEKVVVLEDVTYDNILVGIEKLITDGEIG